MASSEAPPSHPWELGQAIAEAPPAAVLQQPTSCCGDSEREETEAPPRPWMRYIDSMAAVAAKAQQEPGGEERDVRI